jgi:MYXO-CTERM domain-containing protein
LYKLGHACFAFALAAAACAPKDPAFESSSGQPLTAAGTELAKLLPTNGLADQRIGHAVDVDGTYAVLGTQSANGGGVRPFSKSGTSWTQQQTILPQDPHTSRNFGVSVGISGSTVIVGAPSNVNSGPNYNAAYIFVRNGTTYTQQAKIVPVDVTNPAERFGASVAIDGDTVAIGNPAQGTGSVYLFGRNGTAWSQLRKLVPSAAGADDLFGTAVALEGGTVVVGAPQHDGKAGNAGAVYVFTGSGTNWSEQARLHGNETDAADKLGGSVAFSNGTLIAGAEFAGVPGATGGAWVFRRSGTTWAQEAMLVASDPAGNDHFGISVALEDNLALVGSYWDDDQGQQSGSAYLYTRRQSTWTQRHKLTASDAALDWRFGISAALSGNRAIIGASFDSQNAHWSGAAYEFAVAPDGASCASDAECASTFCTDGVCCEARCDGACQTCRLAGGSSGDGRCGVVPAGQPGAPACAPYLCDGSSATCPTTCANDGACVSAAFCNATGTCAPDLPNGEACSAAARCESGFCVDGVCCDTECTRGCEACTTATKGQGQDGVCGPVADGLDPRDACDVASALCGADGNCDGNVACRQYAPLATPCGATLCAVDRVSGQLCDGAGACKQLENLACAPYRCDGDLCGESCSDSQDCSGDAQCFDNVCRAPEDIGAPCTSESECDTGYCVDGVCCTSECAGQCETCGAEDSKGRCSAKVGEPDGDRPACVGTGTCAGRCDGINRAACTLPGSETSCGEGSTCSNGVCTQTRAVCVNGGADSQAPDGVVTPCAPFTCEPSSGECRTSCSATPECTRDAVCNANGRCVTQTTDAAEDEGCGCSVPGSVRGRAAPIMAALLLVAAGARRRRRRVLGRRC